MRQKEEPNRQAAPAATAQDAPQAFLSYAHVDDEALGGLITRVHMELELKVRAVTGESFPIFLDHDGIECGEHWRDRLEEALAGARFLIPILTPSYFTSEFCREEAETFLKYEAETGRKDLVLPIYLIDADVLNDKQLRDADPLAKRLGERQHADWRHLAVLPADDPQLPAGVMGLAQAIKKAVHRPRRTPPEAPPPETSGGVSDARDSGDTRRANPLTIRFVHMLAVALLCLAAGLGGAWWVFDQESSTRDQDAPSTADQPTASGEQSAESQERTGEQSPETGELEPDTASPLAQQTTTDRREVPLDRSDLVVKPDAGSPHADTAPVSPFRDCDKCPEMVVIPAGSFEMGSPVDEEARFEIEGPLHTVTIRQPFAMGKYEVTFAEWDACVAERGCKPNKQSTGGPSPVTHASWKDAKAYVEWLTKKTGHGYRLPSEAEWEYAARAGKYTRYAFGDEITEDQANFGLFRGAGGGETTEVGRYTANEWDLYDMHGNVWEWVEDCRNDDYEGAPNDGSAWLEGNCNERVLRGGAWNSHKDFWNESPWALRSAHRDFQSPTYSINNTGFRVAKTLRRPN